MEEIKTTVDTPAAVPEKVETSTTTDTEELTARLAKLEEEKENYKKAFLKEKSKNKPQEDFDEEEESKIRRIAQETIAESRILEIEKEKDAIIQKALRENKELKLALSNKSTTTPPGTVGTHSESIPVTDTSITPEQLAYFKSRNWSEADIARYKKTLQTRR